MEELLNHAPCGFLSFRDDGTIIRANQTLRTWLGYSEQGMEGLNIESIFTVATRIFYNTHLFPLIRLHLKADEIFLSLKTRNNMDVPALCNAVRTEEGGEAVNHCVFIQVHQRKKYEQELLTAKKLAEQTLHENAELKSLTATLESKTRELDNQYSRLLSMNHNLVQFSKIISHDLQEPIHKIKVFISMVEMYDTENLSDKGKSALQKINRAADRLKQLTTGLEQFVKVDTEKKFTSVDLNKALTSALSNVMAERQFTDFEIIGAPLPVIEGYEAQLGLLFYHLIDNSIQFRQPSERLVIKIDSTLVEENVYRNTPEKYRYLEHIRIHFSDNGIGFENQYQDYVFDLVKKIDPLSRGLGIGLSLIKKIVSNHSGSVEVNSELGKGTRFTILLPTKIDNTLS